MPWFIGWIIEVTFWGKQIMIPILYKLLFCWVQCNKRIALLRKFIFFFQKALYYWNKFFQKCFTENVTHHLWFFYDITLYLVVFKIISENFTWKHFVCTKTVESFLLQIPMRQACDVYFIDVIIPNWLKILDLLPYPCLELLPLLKE